MIKYIFKNKILNFNFKIITSGDAIIQLNLNQSISKNLNTDVK